MPHIEVGGIVRAAVDLDNDLRDEGMGVIRCARQGDRLTVHDIRDNGTFVVSKVNNEYPFICTQDEITCAL